MTSPYDHSTPNHPSDTGTTGDGPSLARLLETWQAWNGREVFARAAAQARAAGDDDRADRLRDMLARDREVAALDALSAQHEMSALLAGWEWHTVRAAREQGATWADIAHAIRTDPEQARTAYLEQVGGQEQAAARGWLPFDDAPEYRAAAGTWSDELHPDTPDHVVEQIEGAIWRDDVDELAALRSAWWNPAHVPPVTVFDAPTAAELERSAHAQAAAERGDYPQARQLMGIDDAELAAALDAAAAGPVTEGDEVDPWASLPGADQVPHTHTAVGNRGFLGVAIDATDAETEAIEAAQDAADRAFGADIDAEIAEADALYGPDGHEHDLGRVRVPGPAQFDDQWRTPGPHVPGIDIPAAVDPAAVDESGNDLARDVERVLAHLRVQNTHHERAAGPLWDMPPERWEASLAALRAGGYEITTSTSTHGDTASNSTAYWLQTDPARDRPATPTTDQPLGWWAQARSTDPDVPPVVFDRSGYYSDADIAAIGDALAAGDTNRAEALQNRPWFAQGVTVDTGHVHVTDDRPALGEAAEPVAWPVMPEWMRDQARRTEADPAATPARPDDRAEIASWLATLREQAATGDPPTVRECNRVTRAVPSCGFETDDEHDARREQLTRWHTDDTHPDSDAAVDGDHDTHGDEDSDGAGPGDRFILVDGTEQP